MLSRFASLCLFAATASAVTPIVDLGYSKYEGTALQNGVTQWLGMRYAAPPLGNLRFRAPQGPLTNSSLQQADQHGPICLPVGQTPIQAGYSEDCLFLDVYSPTVAKTSQMPVYVFFQGGGFEGLANANYNGSGLITASSHNILVVTLNYRVGPYGFLATNEFSDFDTNNGLRDQRAALQWVQKHISQFGGDPTQVVIGGASAGGQSVVMQLTAYGGRDDKLFVASAAESQSFPAVNTVASASYIYNGLAGSTGCNATANSLQCLRNLTAATLQQHNTHFPRPDGAGTPLYNYGPVIDNGLVQDYTYRMFMDGKFIHVPAIFGDDTNEGTVFTPKATNSYADMNAFLRANFPKLNQTTLQKIDQLYPKAEQFPNSGQYWRTAANAYGEIRYTCPGEFVSGMMAAAGVPVWNYRYNVHDPSNYAAGLGTTHTEELSAIWGPANVGGSAPASYTGINANIVPVVQALWTSFVRSHNPNTYRKAGTPQWNQWTDAGKARIMLRTNATKMETVPSDQAARCAYLESIAVSIDQ